MGHSWIKKTHSTFVGWFWKCDSCGSTCRDLVEYVTASNLYYKPGRPDGDALIYVHDSDNPVNRMTCEEVQSAQVMKS